MEKHAGIDSIRGKFVKLKERIDKEKIENIGLLDLRKWATDIVRMQEESEEIKHVARFNIDVEDDELEEIYKMSQDLWDEMSNVYEAINAILEGKLDQVREYCAEVAEQKAIIEMFASKKAVYAQMADESNRLIADSEEGSELGKLCLAELEAENKKIDKLEELIQKHREICFAYNEVISVLRYGGQAKKPKVSSKAKEEPKEEAEEEVHTEVESKAEVPTEATIDAAFRDGVKPELLDKAFANGTEKYVGLEGVEGQLEDGDIAEIKVPQLEDQGKVTAQKEVLHMIVDGTAEAERVEAAKIENRDEPIPEVHTEVVEEEEVAEETAEETASEDEETYSFDEAVTEVVLDDPTMAEETPATPATPAIVEVAQPETVAATVNTAAPTVQETVPTENVVSFNEAVASAEAPAPAQPQNLDTSSEEYWMQFFENNYDNTKQMAA